MYQTLNDSTNLTLMMLPRTQPGRKKCKTGLCWVMQDVN